jgi:Mrp family chromosome partitioning ATPase
MDNILSAVINNLDREMALTAYDGGTLAIGTTARVKELLTGKSKVDTEIVSAANKRPGAVMSLAMRTPKGMEQFLSLDNDTLGNSLKGIRLVSGYMDVANSSASLALSAKMATVEQATGIKQTLDGFKSFLPALFSGGKQNNQVFGRLVENARITRVGSNVSLSLTIPQSDIDVLVGK